MKNLIIQETIGTDGCQLENISSKVNTVDYDKISSY